MGISHGGWVAATYLTVALCVIRAIPALITAAKRFGFALVASRVSRATYGTSKVVAFVLLFSLNAAQQMSGLAPAFLSGLEIVAVAATYLTVALCVIRAIPVVTAAKRVVL